MTVDIVSHKPFMCVYECIDESLSVHYNTLGMLLMHCRCGLHGVTNHSNCDNPLFAAIDFQVPSSFHL